MGYSQNSLVSCIYDMALGRASWDSILDLLAATFPDCLVLVTGDELNRHSNLVFAQRGLKPSAVTSYIADYAILNPYREPQAAMAPGRVFHDDQLVPREVAAASEFHRGWLTAQGDFAAMTGVVILREGSRQLTLEVRYPVARQTELRDHVAAILGEAATHFARAFEIAGRARFPAGRGYLDGLVEDLPFAVFFVDENLRIAYANSQAETLRRHAAGPFVSADGILRVAEAVADQSLRQLVQRTLASKRAPTAVLPIATVEGERFFAVARAAARPGQHFQLHDVILDPGPLAMLIVHGSNDAASLPLDLLWRAFALTESEALLAEALLAGATVADYARERAVSKQTLRNQLVGVMRKTRTRRQSELVSLLTRLALTCL